MTDRTRTHPAATGSSTDAGLDRSTDGPPRTMLVAGVSGLVGHATARRALEAGWRVIGVSRRTPTGIDGLEHHAVDLLDPDATAALAPHLVDVTHVVYAALQEDAGLFAGWLDRDTIERNVTMLRNLMAPVVEHASGLGHVTLLHGTKAYGVHRPELGMDGVHLPLRERDPVRAHPNFYFEQAAELDRLRATRPFEVTVFRPTVIIGDAVGVNMNPLAAIAAYATILRHLDRPMSFPGRHHDHVRELVDADIVADAAIWAATSPSAHGGTFNLTNGDVYTWAGRWPALADAFGLDVGAPEPALLAEWLPAHADAWRDAVDRWDLRADPDVVTHVGVNSMVYADLVLGSLGGPEPPPLILNSTIAARAAGFTTCIDTEDSLRRVVDRLRAARIVP